MQYDYAGKPSATMAYLTLHQGESVFVEPGAMSFANMGVRPSLSVGPGNFIKGLSRRYLAQEAFIMTKYTATAEYGQLGIVSPYPGDIEAIELPGDEVIKVQSGSLLAASEEINEDVKAGTLSTLVLKEGITLIQLSVDQRKLAKRPDWWTTPPVAFIAAYGALVYHDLEDGEQHIIDTGHLVAFQSSIDLGFNIMGKPLTAYFSREGLIGVLTGPGRYWMQTRSEKDAREWLMPERGMNEKRPK